VAAMAHRALRRLRALL